MQMGKTNPKAQLGTPFLTPWATIVFNICAAMSMNELIMATPHALVSSYSLIQTPPYVL